MLKLDVYNKNTAKNYTDFLAGRNIELDIYYYPEFLGIDAVIQKGEYEIVVIYNETACFVYPYIKSPIPFQQYSNYFDITSPYGYAGPYINTNDTHVFELCEQKLVDYLSSSNVVCEFIRYHYLYNKGTRFNLSASNHLNRKIVVLDLKRSSEGLWKNEFSSKCRNLYRKMEKENYEFEFANKPDDLKEFYSLYIETMKNANADDFYYFPFEMIQKMHNDLGKDLLLCKLIKDNITYASALFFIKNKIVTYYLSSRNLNYPKVNANNFLLAKVIQWAASQGNHIFNLGGGDDDKEENSLLAFKKNFSKNEETFFIGKRILNTEVYDQLKTHYQEVYGRDSFSKKQHILQFYR